MGCSPSVDVGSASGLCLGVPSVLERGEKGTFPGAGEGGGGHGEVAIYNFAIGGKAAGGIRDKSQLQRSWAAGVQRTESVS